MADGFTCGRCFIGFALPQSPMAKPRAVVAGNAISALIGIAVIYLVSESLWAMPLAASPSILGVFVLRCLHPPTAAIALTVVLSHVTHTAMPFTR
jgi:CBS domain-containing membrane protein